MRTLCDVCESAAASYFCAADEAALCRACDDKVHMCNKLASRHVRVKLADPSALPRCDICENAPAFFYCEVDGSSLCLQCDMIVHVGGKKTHGRYLLLRQRVEFPENKPSRFGDPASEAFGLSENMREPHQSPNNSGGENQQNHRHSLVLGVGSSADGHKQEDNNNMIDLNMKPQRLCGSASNTQFMGPKQPWT